MVTGTRIATRASDAMSASTANVMMPVATVKNTQIHMIAKYAKGPSGRNAHPFLTKQRRDHREIQRHRLARYIQPLRI